MMISPTPWLPGCAEVESRQLRLFCLPYAGSSAAAFRGWQSLLPRSVGVCPIQLPSRGSRLRETPYYELRLLVAAIARAIRPRLGSPFAFFGHSMGAVISFELCRHLREESLPGPIGLFVSGRRAPQLPETMAPLHVLSDKELLNRIQALDGTPREILDCPDLVRIILPALRADLQMVETYRYSEGARLSCPIIAFAGRDDHTATVLEMDAWRLQTESTFSLTAFAGNHFFVKSAQADLLHKLSDDLGRLWPGTCG